MSSTDTYTDALRTADRPPKLKYTIHSTSSSSRKYLAHHILVDTPEDVTSRWSSAGSGGGGGSGGSGTAIDSNGNGINGDEQARTGGGGVGQGGRKEWVLIQLDKDSIVYGVTFGKFQQAHPCNMKDFRITMSLDLPALPSTNSSSNSSSNNPLPTLSCSLKNDSTPEYISLPYTSSPASSSYSSSNSSSSQFSISSSPIPIPTRYILIEPLNAHGINYNISIWHVSLHGIDEEDVVEKAKWELNRYKEDRVRRYMLKYLRRKGMFDVYRSLLLSSSSTSTTSTTTQVEHKLVTALHQSLVINGDFEHAERIWAEMAENGLMDGYLRNLDAGSVRGVWKKLEGRDRDGDVPSARSGHAMCMSRDGKLWVYGGWDGKRSLDDLWMYDVSKDRWEMVCAHTSEEDGPGKRSCHKTVMDEEGEWMYVLGRLDDEDAERALMRYYLSRVNAGRRRLGGGVLVSETIETSFSPPITIPNTTATTATTTNATNGREKSSEFYRRHVRSGKWERLSGNGEIVHDHQMVLDEQTKTIWVSGGRVVQRSVEATGEGEGEEESMYGGLWKYEIRSDTWTFVSNANEIPGRFGHAMVLDPIERTLLIMGGQRDSSDVGQKRDTDYLNDVWVYDVDKGSVPRRKGDMPEGCYTHRAVGNWSRGEVYVMGGMARDDGGVEKTGRGGRDWVYKVKKDSWSLLSSSSSALAEAMPVQRYASQISYDINMQQIYMHGGNAGRTAQDEEKEEGHREDKRLDDLWVMRMERVGRVDVVRKGKGILRSQRYKEMCESGKEVDALEYLKSYVSDVLDDNDEGEGVSELVKYLLVNNDDGDKKAEKKEKWEERNEVLEKMVKYVDERWKLPEEGDLVDFVGL